MRIDSERCCFGGVWALILMVVGTCAAQSLDNRSGIYGVVKGGYGSFQDSNPNELKTLDRQWFWASPDEAWMAGGGVGLYLGAFRLEGELTYISTALGRPVGVPCTVGRGV